MPFILVGLLVLMLTGMAQAKSTPTISAEQQQALGIHTTPPVADDVPISASVIGLVQQPPAALTNISRPYELQIKQLLVKEGDWVKQGQALAVLYVPQLHQLEHQYHNALSSAQLAEQKKQREARLLNEGIVPLKQYEVTQLEYQHAKENAMAIITQISRMDLTNDDLTILKDPRNRHLEGKINLNAPADGKVQQINLTVGDSFDANQPLMTLLTSNTLTIDIPLTQAQLGQLTVGDTLQLSDDTPIKVINIQSLVSDAQKVMVTASFQHPNLRAGQRTRVNLSAQIPSKSSLWRLPRQAVVYLENRAHVFLLKQQQLSAHPLELIRATREGWVVASDELTSTSAVVVSGTAAAKAIYTESLAQQ